MKRIILIFSCVLITLTSAFAQGIDAKILKLQKATYTAPFTEVKVMPKLKKETVREGNLEWRSPDYLRMDFTEPEGDYNLIEGVAFTVCNKGMVQKLPAKDTNTKTGVLRETLVLAFQGKVADIAELNHTDVNYSDKGGRYVCELVAEQPKHGVKALTLEYDKKNGHLLLLTITETNGNYTTWKTEK